MKVIVSCGTKFHSFHLAEELQERGHLHRLMTSFYDPSRNGRGYDIERSKISTNLLMALLFYSPRFVPLLRKSSTCSSCAHDLFDRWVARNLDECDILVAWAAVGLHSIREANKRGIVTIVDRGSAHAVVQKEILLEEYERLGVRGRLPNDSLIEKQLREYEEADYIAIPSSFVRRSFIEKGIPEDKLLQVPYGVSLEYFRAVPKEGDVFRVMHIGCNIQKGTHYLIQAMAELDLKNAELLLIGSPNEQLRAILNKYEGPCKLLRYVPHLELYKTYSQSSVFVLPSIQEGLAMSQAEAMACGVPVICTTNTGGEDIIRDGVDGFVVPVRDVAALKAKILHLYEYEEERRAMSQSALRRAGEFTWEKYGERLVSTYRHLLRLEQSVTE